MIEESATATLSDFVLDPRLAAESVVVADLKLSRILLCDHKDFPWLILVPRRVELVELIDLSLEDQAQLWQEITQIVTLLKVKLAAHKVNVAALGNVVRQLHVHVIARFLQDKAWPGVVWGKERYPYSDQDKNEFVATLRQWLLEGVVHV